MKSTLLFAIAVCLLAGCVTTGGRRAPKGVPSIATAKDAAGEVMGSVGAARADAKAVRELHGSARGRLDRIDHKASLLLQ